jgi:uncharacterized metal-binding protein YceD (DUF177 family)
MSLKINLRHLEETELHRKGELSAEEMDWGVRDEAISAVGPLAFDLVVQRVEDALLVQGGLRLSLECVCVRCLKSFPLALKLSPWTRHLPLQGEESAPVVNDCVDLTPYVREDILLEFPRHPLCDAECRGLPRSSIGKSHSAASSGKPGLDQSAWAELNKLKL